MILDDDDTSDLIGDLATLASTKLDNVVMMIHLLTFDFKLTFFTVVLEVDKKTDDAC